MADKQSNAQSVALSYVAVVIRAGFARKAHQAPKQGGARVVVVASRTLEILEHAMTNKDVFISYRRDGGSELAQLVTRYLEARGYRVCLDVTTLRSGHFDDELRRQIANAKDFILLLTPSALDRCDDPEDWVRREIALALQLGIHFVPVMRSPFSMPAAEELPQEINDLPRHNAVDYEHGRSEHSLADIASRLRSRGNWFRANQWRLAGTLAAVAAFVAAMGIWLGFGRVGETTQSIQADTTVIRDATNTILDDTQSIKDDAQEIKTNVQLLGKMRGLVPSPKTAAEHYHNAMVHVQDGNTLLAEEAFQQYFSKADGDYYDPYLRYARLIQGKQTRQVAQTLSELTEKHPSSRSAKLVNIVYGEDSSPLQRLDELAKQSPDFLPLYPALFLKMPSGLIVDDMARSEVAKRFRENGSTNEFKSFLLNPSDDVGQECIESAQLLDDFQATDPMDRLYVDLEIDQDITLLWIGVLDSRPGRDIQLVVAGSEVRIPLNEPSDLGDFEEPFLGGLTVVELPRYGERAKSTKLKFTERPNSDVRIFSHIGSLEGISPTKPVSIEISYTDAEGRLFQFPRAISLGEDDGIRSASFSGEVVQETGALFGNTEPILQITPASWMKSVQVSAREDGPYVTMPQHEAVPTINVLRCDKIPGLVHQRRIEVWVRGETDDGDTIKAGKVTIQVRPRLKW